MRVERLCRALVARVGSVPGFLAKGTQPMDAFLFLTEETDFGSLTVIILLLTLIGLKMTARHSDLVA